LPTQTSPNTNLSDPSSVQAGPQLAKSFVDRERILPRVPPRELDFSPEKFRLPRLPPLLQPIRVDQARRIVAGIGLDRSQEIVVRHRRLTETPAVSPSASSIMAFVHSREIVMIQKLSEPRPRTWTKAEYYRLGELGFFDGQRTELLEGDILVRSPQSWPHASTSDRVLEVLRNKIGSGFWVRNQLPLDLGQNVEPEPDGSVVPGRRDNYSAHPTVASLIVEISDSTLAFDRGQKASLYAQAGVADYWIVNLVDHQLEVYRRPQPDPTQFYGHGYADQTILHVGDTVSPLAAPQLMIAVADLLR
jgi:Uma2 family endonuclease